jgi:hypothetical protein
MAEMKNENDQPVILDLTNYQEGADPDPPETFMSAQLPCAARTRIVCEWSNTRSNGFAPGDRIGGVERRSSPRRSGHGSQVAGAPAQSPAARRRRSRAKL